MSILSALLGLINGKTFNVSVTLGTGYTNMKNKDLLIRTQDSIWASGKFIPVTEDGIETTFCNLAVQAVLDAFGYTALDNMMADAMMRVIRNSSDFVRMKMEDGQFNADLGTVIIAGLDGGQLGQGHGHVCTLTPGKAEWSGHWNSTAPACLSIGRSGICFRSKGVNWAFVPEPELWAWKPSL